MRLIVILVLVLLAPTACAADVTFDAPATITGQSTFTATDAVLLVHLPTSAGFASLKTTGESLETQTTFHLDATIDDDAGIIETGPRGATNTTRTIPAFEAQLAWHHTAPGFLIIAAQEVNATWISEITEVMPHANGALLTHLGRGEPNPPTAYVPTSVPAGIHLVEGASAGVTLTATGVHYLQYLAAASQCPGEPCPASGSMHSRNVGPVENREVTIVELRTDDARLHLDGSWQIVKAAAPEPSAQINGSIRLPRAAAPDCPTCVEETLWLEGNLTLRGLHSDGDGRIGADVSGDVEWARRDEQPTPLEGFLDSRGDITMAAAIGAGVGLVIWFLAPLVMQPQDPLALPRRRILYEYIVENPGTNFRGLATSCSMARGSLARHLTILTRASMIVEHVIGNSKRFYENHGRHNETWRETAALATSDLKILYRVMCKQAPCTQATAIAYCGRMGWSRSTTQHRLQKLVQAGALGMERRGREAWYAVKPLPGVGIE